MTSCGVFGLGLDDLRLNPLFALHLAVELFGRQRPQRRLDRLLHFIQVHLELFGDLQPLALLYGQHHPQGLSRLMRPELVDQMMHVNKEQIQVFHLFFSFGRFRSPDQHVQQVQKVDQNGVIQLVQLPLPVHVFGRVQPSNTLTFETLNDGVLGGKRLPEHGVGVVDRLRRRRSRIFGHGLV